MNIKSNITKKTLQEIEKISGAKLTLGKLIWSIRKCDEISQIEFAKKLGISKQHLCDLEHDRKSVRPKLAAQYAKKLGYSKEQFIELSLKDMLKRDRLKVSIKIFPYTTQTKTTY